MNNIFKTYRPESFSGVYPYIFAADPAALIAFLTNAFYAEEINRSVQPNNGDLANVILKIVFNSFMISQAREPFVNMRSYFLLYAEDVDEMYKRAPVNSAVRVFAPDDMDYDDWQAGVIDPEGNYWQISKRVKEAAYDK